MQRLLIQDDSFALFSVILYDYLFRSHKEGYFQPYEKSFAADREQTMQLFTQD